jgi:hypothetical protein
VFYLRGTLICHGVRMPQIGNPGRPRDRQGGMTYVTIVT